MCLIKLKQLIKTNTDITVVKLVTHAELIIISVAGSSFGSELLVGERAEVVVVVLTVLVVGAGEATFWVGVTVVGSSVPEPLSVVLYFGPVVVSASTSVYTSFCTSCSSSTSLDRSGLVLVLVLGLVLVSGLGLGLVSGLVSGLYFSTGV